MSEEGKKYAGRYRLEGEVGRGGMAVVYRAVDERMKRSVAVKVLYPYLAIKEENKVRFQREAEVVANLDHRNVLKIYDYSGIDSGENYIVSEFIEGDTLKRFVADHPITLPEVGAMMVYEIAGALDHAHKKGVIHRDVKPENVMISARGVLKLMDFGIAQIKDVQQMTVTGTMIGSPAHMSPEHIEGRKLDHRADIFSLGTVLYRLCVDRLPFEASSAHALLKRILDVEYVPAIQANPAVGTELSAIIDRCLHKDPEQRYQSCEALRLDLSRLLWNQGFKDVPGDLARFFKNPKLYQEKERERVIEGLLREGRRLAGEKKLALALRQFDRGLCLNPDREDILHEIERVRRNVEVRRILFRYVLPGVLATGLIVLGAVGHWLGWFPGAEELPGLRGDAFVAGGAADSLGTALEAADVAEGTAVSEGLSDVQSQAAGEGIGNVAEGPDPDVRERGDGSRRAWGAAAVAGTAPGELRQAVGHWRNLAGTTARLVHGLRPHRVLEHLRTNHAGATDSANTEPGEGPPDGTEDKPPKEIVENHGRNGDKTPREDNPPNGGGPQKVDVVEVPVTILPYPPAVEVWVDDKLLGPGKQESVKLPVGGHRLRLHHPSCDACRDTVRPFQVLANASGKGMVLKEKIGFKPALLQVTSVRKGLVLVDDGAYQGALNRMIRLRTSSPAPWTVKIRVLFEDDSAPVYETEVSVSAGRLRQIRVP